MYQFDPEQITLFAKTDARGQQVPFGIKAKDRTKHVYVIGKTGMGKSTLLENMAVQDIKNGNGLAFIDPHGQTAETLLDYIPEERKDDVLYFAPFDTDNPISFNVMEDVGADRRHLVVSGLMSVFKKIWVDAWSARMEYILSNTLLALLEYPDATLLGVNRMLSDKVYRKKVIDNITDPAVKSFWVDEFLKYNERYMQEAGDAIKNKIGQFTSNPLIRNIIGQPKSSFDIRKMMDERKILIMNLSKGLVGESNANLLGSMLTTRIYLAAMSRADCTAEEMKQMPNFYFYVDEFQSFANATFADILSEARKYKLNLTIAHQYIEQMEEEVRNAVFGNVGTIISFRVGPFDAEILETLYTPHFLAADIVNLGFAQIYLTLMIDGIGSHPFSATTLPPIETAAISYKDVVIAKSRANYTQPRAGVENAINVWHEPIREERPKTNNQHNNGKPPVHAGGAPRHNNRPNTNNDRRKEVRVDKGDKNSRQSFTKGRGQEVAKGGSAAAPKSLDDLRSVLKSISHTEKEKQTKQQEKKQQESVVKKKPAAPSAVPENGLKDALAAAIGQKTVTAKVKEDSSVVPEKKESVSTSLPKKTKTNFKEPREVMQTAAKNVKATIDPAKKQDLAAAIESAKQKNQSAPQKTDSVSIPVEKKSISQPKNDTVEVPLVKKTAPTTPSGDSNAATHTDPLSPKKLERMMRVTGQDRPPLT